MLLIIFTMFFSGGLVPQYLLVRDLGLLDSRWAIVLPFAVSAWNLILLRSAFNAVPKDYEEAARMDGAGDFTVLMQVYIRCACRRWRWWGCSTPSATGTATSIR